MDKKQDIPVHLRPVVYSLPDMGAAVQKKDICYKSAADKDLLLDFYLPPDLESKVSFPGVIFVHGGPVAPDRDVKESGQYQSWGTLAAASGLVGITFNHRYHSLEMLPQSAKDIEEAFAFIRQNAKEYHINPDRLTVWVCSGGGPQISFLLRDKVDFVKCLIAYYAILDLSEITFFTEALGSSTAKKFSPINYLQEGVIPFPIFLVRAGLDRIEINRSIDKFVNVALQMNIDIEFVNYKAGQHGFDIVDDTEQSRYIIARTLQFIKENV